MGSEYLVPAAVAASSALTSAYHIVMSAYQRKLASEETCTHDEGAAFIYHSLHFNGELWNRKCWRCGKHEARWPTNEPPPGARLGKGEKPRD